MAQLPQSLAECHAVILSQAQQLSVLQGQVKLLQERVDLDSNNSSKPPSSNGPGQRNRAQRRASARARGAQPGHKGHSRAVLDESQVDQIVECKPAPLCECGQPVDLDDQPQRHQVFEVPVIQARVDEYRLYSGRCKGCGKEHEGLLPAGVPRGQLGPRALALIGTLGTRYHLTQRKIRDLLAQTMGVDFSVGAISQAHGKVAAALKAPVAEAVATLCNAGVVHIDETSYPREGAGNWVWAVAQPLLVLFSVWPSRARYVIHELIGTAPKCLVVSDRYAGYAFIDSDQRQICWAHLLRDFNRIAQRDGVAGRIGQRLLAMGYVMFRWRARGKTSTGQFEPLQRRVRRALEQGASQSYCSRTANTCANVLKLWSALWGFITHPGVEPTNNAAEQALRSIVLKRKISGPTRSRRGDEFIAHGYSVHETCRRQGVDLWGYLHKAIVAWIDKAPHPSMVPAVDPSG